MHHHAITLDLAADIIADLKAAEERCDGNFYVITGWHPDLGEVTIIEGAEFALLICELPLPELKNE
jgi:hypothetical protein